MKHCRICFTVFMPTARQIAKHDYICKPCEKKYNADAQRESRKKKQEAGWKRMWIPPQALKAVKELLKQLDNYKG